MRAFFRSAGTKDKTVELVVHDGRSILHVIPMSRDQRRLALKVLFNLEMADRECTAR